MRFSTILQSHARRYPAWQMQDVYKLVHQASLGPEHMVTDALTARAWLEGELAEMGEGPTDPIIDPISADGEMVRVHLRPYQAGGGDPETLLAAFLETANDYHGSVDLLEANLAQAVQHCIYPVPLMETFFQEMKAGGYPAVHHSEVYKNRYRPAYRVIGGNYVQTLRSG